MLELQTENKLGSDCSGSDGDINRVLTLTNTVLTNNDGFLVFASGLALSLNNEYTVSHATSGTTVTFLNGMWDDMAIIVRYAVSDLTSSDFINGPLTDFSVVVTKTPVTVTTDFHGQKTYTDGVDTDMTVVFQNANQNFGLDKPGLTEISDAKMFTRADATINKYDKITHNSKIYRVDKISDRKGLDGVTLFKSVLLFFID